MKKVKCLLGGKLTVCVDRHTGGLKENRTLVVVWITLMGRFFQVSLANHLALPGSKSVFGVSQDPPIYASASLSRDGFQRRGLWVDLTSFPIWPPRRFVVRKVSLTSRRRSQEDPALLPGQGPASSLCCPAVDTLEFLPPGNELQLLTLGGGYFLPQYHLHVTMIRIWMDWLKQIHYQN